MLRRAGLFTTVPAFMVLAACEPAGTAPPPAAPGAWSGAQGPVAVVRAAPPADPVCPSGSAWSGAHCVRTLVVTEVACPQGSAWDGARCAGVLVADCPPGMQFADGVGCVAVLASPAPAPPAPPSRGNPGVVDPWAKKQIPGRSDASSAAPVGSPCACAAGDLMCRMKCAATCKEGSGADCRPAATPAPKQNTARELDRGAVVTALTDAASAAKACTGVPGVGAVRVTFASSGRVTEASVQSGPFAGTAQAACIATVFRQVVIPPFDGSSVAVTKSVLIP